MFIFCIGLLQCLNECHVPVLPEIFQDIFSSNLCIPLYSDLYIPSTTMFSDLFNTYHNFEDEKNWSRKEIMLRIRRRKMRIIMMRSYTECHVEETRYLWLLILSKRHLCSDVNVINVTLRISSMVAPNTFLVFTILSARSVIMLPMVWCRASDISDQE